MTLKQRLTLISLSLTTLLLYSVLISHSNNNNSEANICNSYTVETSENTEHLINTLISFKDKLPKEIITQGIKGEFLVDKTLELTK